MADRFYREKLEDQNNLIMLERFRGTLHTIATEKTFDGNKFVPTYAATLAMAALSSDQK